MLGGERNTESKQFDQGEVEIVDHLWIVSMCGGVWLVECTIVCVAY